MTSNVSYCSAAHGGGAFPSPPESLFCLHDTDHKREGGETGDLTAGFPGMGAGWESRQVVIFLQELPSVYNWAE